MSTARARPPINPWRRRLIARSALFCAVIQAPAAALFTLWLRPHLGLAVALALTLAAHVAAWTILLHRLTHWVDDARGPWWRAWLLDVPYAAYSTGCFLACAPGYVLALAAALGAVSFTATFAPVLALALLITGWGSTLGRVFATVREREVVVAGLHPDLDGLRVAQLSDVHCGPHLPRWVYRRWVATALARRPDLVALTGDLITTGEGYVADVEDLARALSAPMGVVACMGNHDYFQTERGVSDALDRAGVRLLRNEGEVLTRGAGRLWVAGVDDRWTKRDDLAAALREKPEGVPTLLLAHDPASFPEAVARGVELTLSGHTHAGQIGLPFPDAANLGRAFHRYTAGLYREGASALYVHRGLGITGVPTRVGVWPEVAVIVLRATSSSR